jgi:hypothetical protein
MGIDLGDTTGNGMVNGTDISETKAQTGMLVTGANFRNDVTANGVITASDIGLVKAQAGIDLPPIADGPAGGSKTSEELPSTPEPEQDQANPDAQ